MKKAFRLSEVVISGLERLLSLDVTIDSLNLKFELSNRPQKLNGGRRTVQLGRTSSAEVWTLVRLRDSSTYVIGKKSKNRNHEFQEVKRQGK